MRGALTELQDALHRRRAHFLDVAHRLFHERGDAARLVARRGVHRLNRLPVRAQELGAQLVDHAEDLLSRLAADRTGRHNVLTARNARNFRHEHGTACGDHEIGHGPDNRVPGNGGRPVGTAALHAHNKPGQGARLAFQILRGPLHLADELTASGLGFDGSALLLNEDGVHGLAAADGDLQVKRPDLLTAEPHDEDAGHVGMLGKRGEGQHGAAETLLALHAAALVGQRDGPGLPRDMIDDRIRAGDGGDDEHDIPDTHAPVGAGKCL